MTSGATETDTALAASLAMREYLSLIVEERRSNPTGDLISDLLNAEIDGHKLSDEEISGFLQLLLPAGAETTFRAMGNALVPCLRFPACSTAC